MKNITKSAMILCFASALLGDVKSMISIDGYMDLGFRNLRKNILFRDGQLENAFQGYHVKDILWGYQWENILRGHKPEMLDIFRGYEDACAVRQSFVGQPESIELGTFSSADREQLIVTLVAFLDADKERRTALDTILESIVKCDRRFRIEIISAFLRDVFENDEQKIAITAAFLETETIIFLKDRKFKHTSNNPFHSEDVASVACFKDYEIRMAEADRIVDRITARVAEERVWEERTAGFSGWISNLFGGNSGEQRPRQGLMDDQ
ncbi:MAG: hypothetical protein LBJ96_03085 [Holosporaceae bacterium]|jgi:hypothetical protein|nr:hypothetical protein [Holosporaceae bacterium]